MRQYDATYAASQSLKNSFSMGLCALGACAATYGLFTVPRSTKWMCSLACVGCGAVGLLAASKLERAQELYRTYEDVSKLTRASTLYREMSEPLMLATEYKPFDWQVLKTHRDLHPHLLLLGASGGGKSTLAENLAALFSPSTVYAVVPHWQKGDFSTCDRIIGAGRNVGDGIDGDPLSTPPLYDLASCDNKHSVITACEFLHALYWEMDRRYQLDQAGRFVGANEPQLTVILDEFLLYAKLPGVPTIWKALLREARKVGIRCILLVQGDGVASLGIEGEGDVRENLTYVYLSDFAHNHLHQCYNRATKEQLPYLHWVSQQFKLHRPCMVENEYAILPQPGEFVNVSIERKQEQSYLGHVSAQYEKQGQAEGRTGAHSDHSTPNISGHTYPLPVDDGSNASDDAQTEDFLEGYDEVCTSLTPEQLDRSLKGLHASALAATTELTPSGRPYTREFIIKKVWGYQSGQYKIGKVLWALAEQRYGRIPLKD